jgi:hypothetical protein
MAQMRARLKAETDALDDIRLKEKAAGERANRLRDDLQACTITSPSPATVGGLH